jgi:hypothetical protein
MNIKLAFAILTVNCVLQANSLPNFIRGKYFQRPKTSGLTTIPDQYYEQRLDHFDESNIKSWKQVFILH